MKIIIEGDVAEGKTTMARFIATLLRSEGFQVLNCDIDEQITQAPEYLQRARLEAVGKKLKEAIRIETVQVRKRLGYTEIMDIIGSVWATIGGDSRYTTKLVVDLGVGKDTVRLSILETMPIGGMDSRSERSGWKVQSTCEVPMTPKAIRNAILKMIADEPDGVIRTYGKPTKNFTWYTSTGLRYGLSAGVIQAAIDNVVE